MGFIENLSKSIEEKLLAEQQVKIQHATLQKAQEKQRRQQEAQEREFHRKRREQARAFRKDSGIDTVLSSLYELVNRDPAKRGQKKGHIVLFKPQGSSNYPESVIDFIKVTPRQEEGLLRSIGCSAVIKLTYEHSRYTGGQHFIESLEFDEDAIFDVIILGELTSSYSENNNVETYHYATCLVIETTPDGVIAFHSTEGHKYGYNRVRDIVPKDIWENDKKRLEDALGKAFNNPSVIHTGRSSQDFHNTGHIPF